MKKAVKIPDNTILRASTADELSSRSNEIANLYIRVFAEAPWYEKYLIRVDGEWKRMGTPKEMQLLEKMRLEGTLKQENIKPFYTTEEVKGDMFKASQAGGFAAAIALDKRGNSVIGVSWGMNAERIPVEEKLVNVKRIILNNGLPSGQTFYFDETFVDMPYRGIKVGSGLVRIRGDMVRAMGCKYAIVRTINKIQLNNLMSVFGSGNITEAYSNPEDMQPDRKYYIIDLMGTKRKD